MNLLLFFVIHIRGAIQRLLLLLLLGFIASGADRFNDALELRVHLPRLPLYLLEPQELLALRTVFAASCERLLAKATLASQLFLVARIPERLRESLKLLVVVAGAQRQDFVDIDLSGILLLRAHTAFIFDRDEARIVSRDIVPATVAVVEDLR